MCRHQRARIRARPLWQVLGKTTKLAGPANPLAATAPDPTPRPRQLLFTNLCACHALVWRGLSWNPLTLGIREFPSLGRACLVSDLIRRQIGECRRLQPVDQCLLDALPDGVHGTETLPVTFAVVPQ